MFKKEGDQTATAPKILDLKSSCPEKVVEKEFPTNYKIPKLQKFDGRKGNTKEHVARFLNSTKICKRSRALPLRVLQVINRPSLHLVSQFQTRNDPRLIWLLPSILSSSLQKRSTLWSS